MLAACKKTPEGILSKSDMEEVLFDYHIVQGMIDQMTPEQRQQTQRYLDAVFTKHGISEAEFDSSMIWYNRNGVLLKEIYADLNKRYKELEEEIKLKSGSSNILSSYSQTGDTANIWTGHPIIILRANNLLNRESFTLKADSNFRRKDKFLLYAYAAFHKEIRDDRDCSLAVGLTLEYKNGKTTGVNRLIDYNSPIELRLDAAADEDIEALHGYFFYKGKETMRNIAVVNSIALIRTHDKTAPPPADTLKANATPTDSTQANTAQADTTQADTTQATPRRHLSPEEVRRQNKTEDRIQIKAAPDVRTRNSYGPKRKNARKKNSSK